MRILVVSNNPFSETENNGKTLKSLFTSVSSENLAQLYSNTSGCPDMSVCKTYYRISEKDILKSIFNMSFSTQNSHSNFVGVDFNSNQRVNDSKLMKFIKKNKNYFNFLRYLLWNFKTWRTRELDNWIRAFKPQVIFSVLGSSIHFHQLSIYLANHYNIPFVAFFTDDYVINNPSNSFIQKKYYSKLCKIYEETMKKAALVYVIGDVMRIDYEKKYGREMGVLVNLVDFSQFSKIQPIELNKKNEIIISFIGGIHLNRWKSIVNFGKIIKSLNNSLGLNIKIKIFSVKQPDRDILEAFDYNGVKYSGALDYNGVIEQIERSHFLLHVESLDKKNRSYVKYSVSTKIPEYLASKRRVIAYGPHDVASILLLKESSYGCCLTDLDSEKTIALKLMEAIDTYNDFDYDSQYEYALRNFDRKNGENLLRSINNLLV